MLNSAFLWIATRDYLSEAAASIASVRKHHPRSKLFLATPETEDISVKAEHDFYIRLPQPRGPHWFLDSARYIAGCLNVIQDYQYVVYLDTDTYVTGPLDDLIFLLTKFDLVGCHAPGRVTRPTTSFVPRSFPEINIGCNGFRNTKLLRRFVDFWVKLYEDNANFYGNNDQASLREALWLNTTANDENVRSRSPEIKYYIMPPEYNFRFGFGGWARDQIHVLHGRSPNHEALHRTVNVNTKGFRGWNPGELK